jgi:ArsR family transcriptional regulator, lead/cadmium/zinc/bismuth-responsive transcriptional repressor
MSQPKRRARSNTSDRRRQGAATGADHVNVMADVFGMLADPGRLRLLLALREASELTVSDLQSRTGISQSAVSHALRLLRAYHVVSVRREGRHAHYAITDDHVRLLVDATLAHFQHHEALAAPRDRHAG